MDDYEVILRKNQTFFELHTVVITVKAYDEDCVAEYAKDFLAINGWVIESISRADNY
jgi:hypothetical protein